MRKETKIGLLFFAIFNILNFIHNKMASDIPLLHFTIGILVGLGFLYIFIGILPESVYIKIKSLKNNLRKNN
jgi:hypothetical protein